MGKVLIIAGDGTASDHLDYAYFRMLEEGHEVVIGGPVKRPLYTAVHQGQMGDYVFTFERQGYPTPVDAVPFDEIDATAFDGLILPGGRAPEYIRNIPACVALVRHFIDADKPIAAMCHGPILLVSAGLTGRTVTSTDDTRIVLRDAGNNFIPAHGPNAGEPDCAIDGNILTVFRRPFHYVWIREFLKLLEKNGAGAPISKSFNLPKNGRVLIIAGDYASGGQLLYAFDRMLEAGLEVVVSAPDKKRLNTVVDVRETGWNGISDMPGYDYDRLGFWIGAELAFADVDPSQFDGVLLPGWRATEYLRNMEPCIKLIQHFLDAGKPVASICQAPQLLIAAGVSGRRIAGLEFIKQEIAQRNTYVDAKGEPVVDGNIVSVSGRPYYHVWTRSFLSMLSDQHASSKRPEAVEA